jgi:hypothetical protein
MTEEFLRGKKRELGARNFARGFELKPFSTEERTFRDSAILRDPTRRWGMAVPAGWKVVAGFDPATRGQAVCLTVAIHPESRVRLPLDIIRAIGQSPTDTARAIIRVYERYAHHLILVENNATQQSFLDLIQAIRLSGGSPLPIDGHFTGKQKFDVGGLPSLAASMEQGLWPIPMPCECGVTPCECHPADCPCDSCAWIEELEAHPAGRRSDIVMAMWLAEMAARKVEGIGMTDDEPLEISKLSLFGAKF